MLHKYRPIWIVWRWLWTSHNMNRMIQFWYSVHGCLTAGHKYRLEIISSSTRLTVHSNTSLDLGREATCYRTWADKHGAAPESLDVFWSACVKEAFFFFFSLTEHTERGFMCEKTSWVISHLNCFSFIFKLLSGCIYSMYELCKKLSLVLFSQASVSWSDTDKTLSKHSTNRKHTWGEGEDATSCSLLFHCLISQRLFNMQLTEHKEGSLPTRQLFFIVLQSLQECTRL